MICPICKTDFKTGDSKHRPFCSSRCQLIDLGNWLGERYTVPGEAATQEGPNASSAESDDDKRPPQ